MGCTATKQEATKELKRIEKIVDSFDSDTKYAFKDIKTDDLRIAYILKSTMDYVNVGKRHPSLKIYEKKCKNSLTKVDFRLLTKIIAKISLHSINCPGTYMNEEVSKLEDDKIVVELALMQVIRDNSC